MRARPDRGWIRLSWLVLGAPIALTMIVVALVAPRHLPKRSMTLSLGVLFASAVGLEALGGLMLGEQESPYEGSDLGCIIVMHLEEFGEMAGAALAACSPLAGLRLRRHNTDLGLSLAGR